MKTNLVKIVLAILFCISIWMPINAEGDGPFDSSHTLIVYENGEYFMTILNIIADNTSYWAKWRLNLNTSGWDFMDYGTFSEGDITIITPYVNEIDMTRLDPFSFSNDSPWGRAHDGIDFHATGNLKPFQAVCSGVVDKVELWQNDTSNWQVNVRIICNSTYSVEYGFEPMTAVQADGETQLTNISVSEGQTVSHGDIIGYLYTAHEEDAHVHFGLHKNWVAICPEPYFTPEARDSILNLIHKDNPDWNMCY